MTEATAPSEITATRLSLHGLVLDLVAGELLGPDQQRVGLRKQALEVLLVLGRRAGQVIGKNDLMNSVWPGVVVGEGSLTQAIADVRHALKDTEHRIVRNVARRGYMLMPDAVPGDTPTMSIAVMPLEIDGDAEASDWLADALHDDLIAEMTRLYGVAVIARDTTASYKGRVVDPRLIARELDVRHVVQGSLRHEGKHIRLNLSLVEGASGVQIWAEPFIVERADLPQSLAELAVQIVRVLQPELYRSAVARRAKLSALEITADDLAMRGFARWFRGMHADNVLEALKLVERAVALDPECLRGWAGLTFMNMHGVMNDWVPDRAAALRRIDEATAQLERLDLDSSFTYQARTIQCFLRHDWLAMIRISTLWMTQSPNPLAFAARGMAWLLSGEPEKAAADLKQAFRLSPRHIGSAEWQYRLAMAHFAAHRHELACETSQTAAATNPSLPWPPIHAAAMQQLGRTDEAKRAFAAHMVRHPKFRADHILLRLPGAHPKLIEARERLISSLEVLGMAATST